MAYRITADLLLVLHLVFIAFVLLGGLLVRRRTWVAWLHLPAVLWAVLLELNGWVCPLTPWEQQLRLAAGEDGYAGGFIDHYLMPLIYPPGLTRPVQGGLAGIVLALNALVYGSVLLQRRGKPRTGR